MDAIDFSSPMTWLFIALALFEFAHLAFTGTLVLGLVIVLLKKAKADVHEWAAALSKWLDSLGFSATVTAPLDKIAAGDVAGALGAGASLMAYCLNPANAAFEFSNVLPVVWNMAVQKVIGDLQGGASSATIAADLQPAIVAGRAAIPHSPLHTQLQTALSHVQATLSSGGGLPDVQTALSDLGLSNLFPLVAAGATASKPVQTAAQAQLALAAAPLLKAAVATPALAVAAPAAIPAAAAVATGVAVSGLLDGHTVSVSAAPGSAAATAPTVTAA